jgi:soluble lytic murein transglycosylase
MPAPCRLKHALALAALLAAAPALPAAAQPPAPQAADAQLLAAREAFRKGQVKALEAHRRSLAGHLLESYPAYWSLSAQIEKAEPAEVRGFLARWPESPLAESLRREWLKALGAAGSWEIFRAEHPRLESDDPDVVCYALQERLARPGGADVEALAEARRLFVTGAEVPASCDPVFAALADAKQVGTEEAWGRLRKLLAAGLVRDARRTNALLPPRQALSEKSLERAHADPAKYLAAERAPRLNRASVEVALYAVARLARQRPDEAAAKLSALSTRLPLEDLRHGWGLLAWNAAQAHHPRALEWYEAAEGALLGDEQVAWKARAALRAGDWNAVFDAMRSLSPEVAREPSWRYWRARALRAKGSPEAADALLRGLARENHFYGLLAAEELGALTPPSWSARPVERADLERVAALPGIQRSLALYRLGLANEGYREWYWAVKSLEDRELLAASEIAREANLHDRSINTAERTVALHDFDKRYPLPHREALSASSRQWDLDEAWMYGIIRQESRFVADARSRAGAVGLMQLMPATARWVARQIPVSPYRPAMLTQPEVNVQMGTYYYRRVLTELGDPVLATAAYNAGPGRARRWRDDATLEGAIYAETIPFNETRDYVKKVVANAWYYYHRLNGRPASMRALLGQVPARSAGVAHGALASTIP